MSEICRRYTLNAVNDAQSTKRINIYLEHDWAAFAGKKIISQDQTSSMKICNETRFKNFYVHSNDVVLKDNVHGKVSKFLFLVRKQNKTRIF